MSWLSKLKSKSKILAVIGMGVILITLLILSLSAKPKQNNTSPNALSNPSLLDAKEANKDWQIAKETVYKTIPSLISQNRDELLRGVYHDKLMYGDTSKRQIALTFDDGPHPKYTPKILAILKKYNVKATFFLVGEMAQKYPYLVKAEAAAHNNIGNHTFHHVSLTKITPGYVATEIKACGLVLNGILHQPVHLFRPPGGDYNDNVAQVAEAMNYHLILWTDDPGDYSSPGVGAIVDRTLAKADNGGIILIHDGVQQTIDALPQIISILQARGYKFVTIDEMLTDKQR